MLVEIGQWLFLLSPFLFTWAVLVYFTKLRSRLRVGFAAFAGGVVWAIATYLDNPDAGNCCQEDPHIHPHSFWSALWDLLPAMLIFGCIGGVALIVLELFKAKFQKP